MNYTLSASVFKFSVWIRTKYSVSRKSSLGRMEGEGAFWRLRPALSGSYLSDQRLAGVGTGCMRLTKGLGPLMKAKSDPESGKSDLHLIGSDDGEQLLIHS
jgi:hypothetical protein